MTIHHADGSDEPATCGGVSAAALVTLAGLDASHVTGMTIDRPNTTGSVQSGAEVADGFDGDPRGHREATFDPDYNVGTDVHFFRPMRSASDVNATDELDPPLGADLAVHLTTDGAAIHVTASADPPTAEVGTPIRFSVAGGPPDATYTWDFGDDSGRATTTDTAVSHVYATDHRSYDATVTALTPSGASGASGVRVQVGTTPGGDTSAAPGTGAPAATLGGAGSGGGGGSERVGGGHGAGGASGDRLRARRRDGDERAARRARARTRERATHEQRAGGHVRRRDGERDRPHGRGRLPRPRGARRRERAPPPAGRQPVRRQRRRPRAERARDTRRGRAAPPPATAARAPGQRPAGRGARAARRRRARRGVGRVAPHRWWLRRARAGRAARPRRRARAGRDVAGWRGLRVSS